MDLMVSGDRAVIGSLVELLSRSLVKEHVIKELLKGCDSKG